MLRKINRQLCLSQYPIFPLFNYNAETEEETYFYPRVFKYYVFTVPSKSSRGHIKSIAIELAKLTKELSMETLIFLGDGENPWRRQDNDYKPVQEALNYLKDNRVGKHFNGAIEVDRAELPLFTKHLAWLARCNAALPDIHVTDPQQNILGHICKEGNLHLNTLNAETDRLLNSILVNSKLKCIPKCSPPTFRIPHRQTPV